MPFVRIFMSLLKTALARFFCCVWHCLNAIWCTMSGPRHAKASYAQIEIKHTLVLVRHGESTLNDLNKSTSIWVHCPVSEKSVGEEVMFGGKIWKEKSFLFDLWCAIKTLWIIHGRTGFDVHSDHQHLAHSSWALMACLLFSRLLTLA
jgi:hypothetical protein